MELILMPPPPAEWLHFPLKPLPVPLPICHTLPQVAIYQWFLHRNLLTYIWSISSYIYRIDIILKSPCKDWREQVNRGKLFIVRYKETERLIPLGIHQHRRLYKFVNASWALFCETGPWNIQEIYILLNSLLLSLFPLSAFSSFPLFVGLKLSKPGTLSGRDFHDLFCAFIKVSIFW